MKRRKTIFKGYHYRRCAAALWLATSLWLALMTALILINVGDIPNVALGIGLLVAGGFLLAILALRYGNLARFEFARIQPLLGVVLPFESARGK
jgi:hypothetical protein